MKKARFLSPFLAVLLIISCNDNTSNENARSEISLEEFTDYTSENLTISKISDQVYLHTSILQTESFGKVACNGMIVANDLEAIVFDTPADAESSEELIVFLKETLRLRVKAVIPTHFHADCLAGLDVFHKNGIPSYAHERTIQLAGEEGVTPPQHGFQDMLRLEAGTKEVIAEYLGKGHTEDNVIGYFPEANVLFGGCLIKESGAGKGNLEDADTSAWSATVRRIKNKYPDTKVVIPGHGRPGGTELLDYTIGLFQVGSIPDAR